MNDIFLSNNRFLGHTNPIMAAAAADGGSVQDREYIQRAARGIVDAGHLDNLKFWGVAGLVKLRNSGGVDYVPKLYDLSGNSNDGIQTTEANQPKLINPALQFLYTSGTSGQQIDAGNDTSLRIRNNLTVNVWMKDQLKDTGVPRYFIGRYEIISANKRVWALMNAVSPDTGKVVVRVILSNNGIQGNTSFYSPTEITKDEWQMVTMTFASGTFKLYRNGSEETIYTSADGGYSELYDSDVNMVIGNNSRKDASLFGNSFTGQLNDIRIYNTALTVTEIAAIYNQTSYRYA